MEQKLISYVFPLLLGFFITLFFTPLWIRKAKKAGISGRDIHKLSKQEVAESGGVAVLFGFIVGVLFYVAINTFYFHSMKNIVEIFAMISSVLIIGFIGFIDDLLGWKIGLTKKMRLLLLAFASIPLVVINVGVSTMMGIEFGVIYPLILVPIGIMGASATFNFIAGYNGLEASQGILILSALAIVSFLTGNGWLSFICLAMVVCLATFYVFNKYPARVFPGDILTYSVGALIAIASILGNFEKIAVFFFTPYIIETFLKIRGGLKKESFAKVNSDGSLEMPYKKFYGLEHIAIYILRKIKKDGKVYENEVVFAINLFQIAVILIGFALFGGGLNDLQ